MKTTFGLPKKREEVINLLQEAYADGNLEDDDYEQRLGDAMDAKSIEDLQIVIQDFPNPPQLLAQKKTQPSVNRSYSAQPAPTQGWSFTTLGSMQNARRLNAILGDKHTAIAESISTPLRVSTTLGNQKLDLSMASCVGSNLLLRVESILGETVIDLRGERFRDKLIQISIHNFLGEIRILLPKGAQVDNQVASMLGEVKHRGARSAKNVIRKLLGKAPAPVRAIPMKVSIQGNCVLGNVSLIHE